MNIIYCDSVFDNKVVEPDYENEMKAAKKSGFTTALISFEELTGGNISRALRLIPSKSEEEIGIYRGWMLTPKDYEKLYTGLLDKNIRLINAPENYKHCHYLPDSYAVIEEKTPVSNWSNPNEELTEEVLRTLAKPFGNNPIIVKDYVKSQKHNWEEACFIPNASDSEHLQKVVGKFLEFRGDDLNEGIVFRKFEELEFLTNHSKSGMPLTKEFRMVFARNRVAEVFNYWDEGEYSEEKPDLSEFEAIGKLVKSDFFTMDVAQKKDGTWIIMELGDGQVAGLPDNADIEKFYDALIHLF